MAVTIAARHLCKKLGEGPFWEESSQSVLVVDMIENGIRSHNIHSKKTEQKQLEGNASIIIPSAEGGYIISQGKKLCHFDWNTDKVTELHQVETHLKTRFNDGKCDASGRLWAGTMSSESDKATQVTQQCSMYTLETDGRLVKRFSGINLSNGLAWSADNRTMYYNDTAAHSLFAFDFNLATGEASGKRVVKRFDGYPDGMCIDVEDKLWIAFVESGEIRRVDPVTGDTLRTVKIPGVVHVTSCCFGGNNLEDLYVTTCSLNLLGSKDFRGNEEGGSLFCVTGLGVKGAPVGGYGQKTAQL